MAEGAMALSQTVRMLHLAERELLLFSLVWYLVGMADDAAVDLGYIALRLTGRITTAAIAATPPRPPASAPRIAVFVPAWREAAVIGATITHMLSVWRDPGLALYVGCYANDSATISAAMAAANDRRLRIVIHPGPGPTTKGDCLNRLYAALCADEARNGVPVRGVLLHDAEDMVHPLALDAIDNSLDSADLVQIPVRPELPAGSRWIAGHYADEFTESHAKALPLRSALGAAVPGAGVGCGIARAMLARIAAQRSIERGSESGPFAAESLTEDYELGMLVHHCGGRTRFLRLRDAQGGLVATRSYFPATLATAARQKARWVHGIALQAWDRLGWQGQTIDLWMALRDRKGPLAAVVLASGYLLLVVEAALALARGLGISGTGAVSPLLRTLMQVCVLGVGWRMAMRALFVGREYGWGEAPLAVARIPVANVVAIMAAHRALSAYCRTLTGGVVRWDKTVHDAHPALARSRLPRRARAAAFAGDTVAA